jgi:hypothetical protein
LKTAQKEEAEPRKRDRRKVKLKKAYGGCLGAKSRRRARSAAKRPGEPQAGIDPGIPEWGNPMGAIPHHPYPNKIR